MPAKFKGFLRFDIEVGTAGGWEGKNCRCQILAKTLDHNGPNAARTDGSSEIAHSRSPEARYRLSNAASPNNHPPSTTNRSSWRTNAESLSTVSTFPWRLAGPAQSGPRHATDFDTGPHANELPVYVPRKCVSLRENRSRTSSVQRRY